MFQCTIIAGLGLMGTSLALAMREQQLSQRYFGVDTDAEHAKKALQMEAVDRVVDGRLPKADFLVLCAPVEAFGSILKNLPKEMPAHCLIIDIGSVKMAAIAEVLKHLPEHLHSRYVPCHPIAGATSYGPDAADAHMYEGRSVIITPHVLCSDAAMDAARQMWKQLGAVVRTLSPEKHDRIYAYVSHLPQLLAYAFLLAYQGEILPKGTERFLRIGGSNPQLWAGIFMANREAILLALEDFQMVMRRSQKPSAYGQMQEALIACVDKEHRAYAGPGFHDFGVALASAVEKALPQNPLTLHHEIATLHNILHLGDKERLLSRLRKAKSVHSQCFV